MWRVFSILCVLAAISLFAVQAHGSGCGQVSYSVQSYAAPVVTYQRAVAYQTYAVPQQQQYYQPFSLGYDQGQQLQQQVDQLKLELKVQDQAFQILKLQQQIQAQQPPPVQQFQQPPSQPPVQQYAAPPPPPQQQYAPGGHPPAQQQQYQQQHGYPQQQEQQPSPHMQKISRLGVLQNRCQRCHDATTASSRGGAFTLLQQGRPVLLTAAQEKLLFDRVAIRRDMPPGPKLSNEELWVIIKG